MMAGMAIRLQRRQADPSANGGPVAGGGMVIRMGGAGRDCPPTRKLTPGEQEKIDTADGSRGARRYLPVDARLVRVAHPALDAQYTYAGEAESPDGKAHVIDAKNADGFAARLFIDQATNLPLMVTYQGPQPRMMTAGGPRPARRGAQAARTKAAGRELHR